MSQPEKAKPTFPYGRTPGWKRICEIIGNGNFKLGKLFLIALAVRVFEARHKHPEFAAHPAHALGVIGREYQELEHAVLKESRERQEDEALDVAVTCLRFCQREYERESF